MNITIDREFQSLIPPLTPEEKAQLENNLISEGCRDALIVWGDILLDGHNRLEICKRHGIQYNTSEMVFDSRDDAKIWIIKNQFGRRNLNAYQQSTLAIELKAIFAEKGKLNLSLGGGDKKSEYVKSGLQISAKAITPIDTREEIAKLARVSHDTIHKVEIINAKATPEQIQQLKNNDPGVSINKVFNDIVRETKRNEMITRLESIETKQAKKIEGVYDVIVIDPPWQMEKIERDVAPNQSGFDYPTMSIDDIIKTPFPTANDCHVWMWTTQKYLPYSFKIFAEKEVKYVCTFVWHKNGGFQPFGLPQYNCEFVVYGRIGTPQFIDFKNFFTCFSHSRCGHSEKPEEFYDMVRRVTAGRRLDMFSRREIYGFDVWGNEVG